VGAPVDIEDLASAIRRQISPAALRCYKQSLAHAPGQSGTLVLSIRVTAAGRVEDVKVVKNAGLNVEVSDCLAATARAATFPCNPGGLVNVPFNFAVSKPGSSQGDAGS
jgi:TonB family protein